MLSKDPGSARLRADPERAAAGEPASPSRCGAAHALPSFTSAELDRQIFDAAPLAMWVVDDDSLRFVDANAAAVERFGWTREEFLELTLGDLHSTGELPIRSLLAGVAGGPGSAGEVPPSHATWRARTKDGAAVAMEVARRDVLWDGRRAGLIVAVDAPLPASVAERELESFSHSISHDLKEPVRAIEGLTSILLADHAARMDPDARQLLARLESGAARLRERIEGLLALSRVERQPLELADVDMLRIAREAATGLAADAAGRKVQLTIGDLPPCRGDAALLRVVFSNLLSNALKFTREREQATIVVGASGGAYFVRDNGVGLEMRHAERVFAPFERLHPHERYEGSGIGLATVRRIVERHRGRVWVEAAPDAGATFSFALGVLPAS